MTVRNFSLLLLRLVLGTFFLSVGLDKILHGFSAGGYLRGSTGPFAATFHSLAGNTTVDFLVVWGLALGGLALILGFGLRLASAGLAVLMLLIYLSHFPPAAPNWYIDDHIIYIAGLLVLVATDAGSIWGLGKKIKGIPGSSLLK